jgi:hypothetical protein
MADGVKLGLKNFKSALKFKAPEITRFKSVNGGTKLEEIKIGIRK